MCISIPVQVVELRPDTAIVASDTRQFEVGRQFLPEAQAGQWVLTNSGQMISIVAASEVEAIRDLLRELTALGFEH